MRMKIWPISKIRAIYWIAGVAFALRLVVRVFGGIDQFWVNGYTFFFDLAQSIASGHGIAFPGGPPTAFRVPLYSILLAGLTWGRQAFWPIAIAQSAIGALTVLGAAQLARTIFSGEVGATAATWAAAVTAFYPYYVIHDTAIEETSFFTLLTLLSVLLVLWSLRTRQVTYGALAGLFLGLDVLTRATMAPFALLVPFWLAWQKRFRAGLACGILLVVTVSPWLWRNYVVTGVPTLSTETGIELWTGNNGFLFHYYPQQSSDLSKDEAIDALTPLDQRELDSISKDENATSRWFAHKAWDYIQQHPRQTIVDGFRKIAAGFSFLPSPRRGRFADLVYAVSYGPVMVIGLWGMWRRRNQWRYDSLIYLLFVTFLAVTAAFWAHTSHRVFLDVYWIVFGCGAIVESGWLNKSAVTRSTSSSASVTPEFRRCH